MAIFYQISQIEDEVDDVNKTEFEKLEKSLEEKSPETWWYCETRDNIVRHVMILWDSRLCYLTSPNNKWLF